MRNIKDEQIKAILEAIYTTNIPAQTFDGIKNILLNLPVVKEEEVAKKETK